MIEKYNMHMGGVDKGDQFISYYGFSQMEAAYKMLSWLKSHFYMART